MQYIDMHCDTLAKALERGQKTIGRLDGTMADVRRLKEARAAAQFFAMFLPQKEKPQEPGNAGWQELWELREEMEKMYGIFQNTLETCADIIAVAHNYEELETNRKNGKVSAFLTIENGFLAEGKTENIRQFYDMGVRLITLTWNDPNCFGFCHSAKPEDMAQGLTDFGKEAVSYMQELGMLVDVSHLSDGGFWDVAELSGCAGKPFVASHSNCRALAPATRNLTDEMIRALADCGGVAGLNFEPTFLNADPGDHLSRVERMCDHVCHLMEKGGVECVGIGTDFDGISGKFEIADCTRMPLLFESLHQRGFSWDIIDKIVYKNVARVIRDGMR